MHSEIISTDQTRRSFIEAARRAQIIDCAIEAIAELGYGQASLAQIAKRAGVSTGVILYYFDGKEDLIHEAVAHIYATGEAQIRPRASGKATERESLLAFIEASVDFIRTHPTYLLAMKNILRAVRVSSEGLALDQAVDEPRRTGLQNILANGQRDGEFRPFSVRVMAVTVIEALDAIPPQLAVDPELDLQAYAAELVSLFDLATRRSHPSSD